jgi:hypothetical protein
MAGMLLDEETAAELDPLMEGPAADELDAPGMLERLTVRLLELDEVDERES